MEYPQELSSHIYPDVKLWLQLGKVTLPVTVCFSYCAITVCLIMKARVI